jgi:hypothetical protein
LTPLSRYAFSILQAGVVPVMAGPGDEKAASAVGRGHLRASHADREQVIGTLKAAFIEGRLTKGELDVRVGQALASRTYGELAALTADLPPGPAAAPPRKPARVRTRAPMGKVMAGAALIVPAPATWVAVFLADSEIWAKIAVYATLVYFMAWMVAGAQIIANWHDKRSRGQLPPRRAQSGQALEGEQSAGTGDELMLSEARSDVRVHHLPGQGVIQRFWQSVPTRRASAGLCT